MERQRPNGPRRPASILAAPFRALIGFRSDHHKSILGWRRVPFIWKGTLIQFGGLSILPFALLVLSGTGTHAPKLVGEVAASLSFLMIGTGLHLAQTAGVALATDLAPAESRPRVVALLYVMLLVGMVIASITFGIALRDFSYLQLVKIIQSAAVATMFLNLIALWKQEPRRRRSAQDEPEEEGMTFREALRAFFAGGNASRLLVSVGCGVAGFSMQDILLEPYGGEVLQLSVASTTSLTALMAGGTLLGLFLAASSLSRGGDPYRLAAIGSVIGIGGLTVVIFSGPLASLPLFWLGIVGIGFGGGWFSVGTLTASMALSEQGQSGLAIGAWGAVQATVAGGSIALGGAVRDLVAGLVAHGTLGQGLTASYVSYSVVYHLEIALLFATLVAIGPLVRSSSRKNAPRRLGLAEFPS